LIVGLLETILDNWDVGKLCFWTKGDDLARTLEIGDNFSINIEFGNVEGVDFYLISCSKPKHVVQ
jgi:hypothetical protein